MKSTLDKRFKPGQKLSAKDMQDIFESARQFQNVGLSANPGANFAGDVLALEAPEETPNLVLITKDSANPKKCHRADFSGAVTVTDEGNGIVTIRPTTGTFYYVRDENDGRVTVGYSGAVTVTQTDNGWVQVIFG